MIPNNSNLRPQDTCGTCRHARRFNKIHICVFGETGKLPAQEDSDSPHDYPLDLMRWLDARLTQENAVCDEYEVAQK